MKEPKLERVEDEKASWSNKAMVNTMVAVQSGETGVNKAVLEFGVPKMAQKDRTAGRVARS